ncbi:MAG: outer membrane beta-barrel protein [Bacteroidota bacterium]
MHTTNIGNLLHLCGRQIIVLTILLTAFAHHAEAQRNKGNVNYYEFQQKDYYFGITLGYNTSRFTPFPSEEFLFSDSIRAVTSLNGPGFNLGIVTNLKVGEYFDFRFLPTLSFSERTLQYDKSVTDNRITTEPIESVFVELPFHLRYKSKPYRDLRLFVIGGVKYGFDVASDSRTRQAATIVKISPTDFAIEYGAGIQFFFPYFIFSPEFKVSHGIGNTLIFNPNLEESTVLEKVLSRTFTISLHFEG